jgi:hypothetical protein
VVVSLSPILVGTISRFAIIGPGDLNGDRALIALSVRASWSHPVLLGPYSRFYWHHPGPLYFYLLALPTRLLGGRTIGLILGATLINLAAATGVVIVAVRRGGRALGVWTGFLLGVYLVALGPATFDPWNPNATLLPFALVLILAWSVACLDVWALPWLALAASFCIQTHVGLAPGVLVAGVASGVTLLVRREHRGELTAPGSQRTFRSALLVSGVVGVLLWLPPIIEQFTSAHGNLSLLARFFAESGSTHSVADGFSQTAFQATQPLRTLLANGHLTDLQAHTAFGLELGLTVLAFLSALWLALVTRTSSLLIILGLIALELAVAVYSVTRIVGPVNSYLVQWISAIGLMVWIALGGGVLEAVRQRSRVSHRQRWRTISALIVLCAVFGVAFRGVATATVSHNAYVDRPQEGVVASILASSGHRHPRSIVLALGSDAAWVILAGTALELEQQGVRVKIVRSRVTELLFAPNYLTDPTADVSSMTFRDLREDTKLSGTLVAKSGRWVVLRTLRR